MLSNLNGWHAVILLVVLLLMVAAVAAVVLVVLAAARRGGAGGIGGKLKALDRLRDQGLLNDAEYQAKRAEILRQL